MLLRRRKEPSPGARDVGPRAALRLIRQPNFGLYFAGNALSATGMWFQNLAAALLVYRLTGSELLLGILSFSQFAAILVLAPWTGSAADRYDRRRLLMVTQSMGVLLAGTLALLAQLDLADSATVIGFALGMGVVSAFSVPAQSVLITQLVERDHIASAVGLNSMTFNLARAVGPALAAVSVSQLGIPASFGLNAASYAIFVIALALIHPREQIRVSRKESGLRESLRLIRREPRLAVLLFIVAAVGFASDPVNTLAPAWAHEFGRPDTFAGFIIGAFGAGAVTAALLLTGRIYGSRRRMTTTLLVVGVGMIAFSLTPWLPLGIVLLFVSGFAYLASVSHATSRLQLEVAEHQRGRIMALWSIAFLGLRPFASLADGAIASAAGVRWAGVVLSIPALLAALVVWLRARRFGSEPVAAGSLTRAE
jgi:MFS family permease